MRTADCTTATGRIDSSSDAAVESFIVEKICMAVAVVVDYFLGDAPPYNILCHYPNPKNCVTPSASLVCLVRDCKVVHRPLRIAPVTFPTYHGASQKELFAVW